MESAQDTAQRRWRDTQRQQTAAHLIELRRQANRPIGINLEEGAQLSLTATTLAASFASNQR